MGLQTSERYEAVANARDLEALSAGLLVIAGCLLVLGALALTRTLVDLRGPGARLVRAGTPMLALGGVWLVAGRAAFNMVFLRVTTDDVPRTVAISMLDAGGGRSSSRSCSPSLASCSDPCCSPSGCAALDSRAGCR